jgi:hypothetical protein
MLPMQVTANAATGLALELPHFYLQILSISNGLRIKLNLPNADRRQIWSNIFQVMHCSSLSRRTLSR